MYRLLLKLFFESILLAGLITMATAQQPDRDDNKRAESTSKCKVSDTIVAEPPKSEHASPFGVGHYFVNANRTMWVRHKDLYVGDIENKIIWIRPSGTRLVVSGKRIDSTAPPLSAEEDHYSHDFTVIGLYFPETGCWQIDATAGTEELHFVTEVISPPEPSHRSGR